MRIKIKIKSMPLSLQLIPQSDYHFGYILDIV